MDNAHAITENGWLAVMNNVNDVDDDDDDSADEETILMMEMMLTSVRQEARELAGGRAAGARGVFEQKPKSQFEEPSRPPVRCVDAAQTRDSE